MGDSTNASRGLQPRLFPVDEPAPWPRRLAIPLTLLVWLVPPATGVVTTLITGNGFAFAGATTLWGPWTWAAPKLVRFMLTGVEDWELPHRRCPTTLSAVDDD
jgi:hypothetical protein